MEFQGTPPDFAALREVVQRWFNVTDMYVSPPGIVTFLVDAEMPVKEKFGSLLKALRPHQMCALLSREVGRLVVRVFPRPQLRPSNPKINIVTMLATIGTILFAGYTAVHSMDQQLLTTIFRGTNLNLEVVMFTVSLFGIIAFHESGHKLAANFHGMDATLPYFVPGPPPIGTFGAVISLRSPPENRDELFDLGFSGPFVGFLVTVVVTIVSILTAPLASQAQVNSLVAQGLITNQVWPNVPLLLVLLNDLNIRTVGLGQTLVSTQVTFAAEVGALITFLNLLPVWQLDGGHIFRAFLGPRGHQIATLIGLMALMLAGYWAFAFLLLIFMTTSRGGLAGSRPLDDISPLSNNRKALFALAMVVLVLCFMTLS
jgi:membrane-associated protease RseP (regulator of RpoE activity)